MSNPFERRRKQREAFPLGRPAPPPTPFFVTGLDLGQKQDFTALAVLEAPPVQLKNDTIDVIYQLRHLQRFPLGTPYTEIVNRVADILGSGMIDSSRLVVDQTGVGRGVVDMLRSASMPVHIIPVTITAGHQINRADDGSWHVPKKELVTCLQILLQNRRLKVAKNLPDADLLVKEMENFKVKITEAANEVFGAWREGQHDDLVLAVALACWWAERYPPCPIEPPSSPPKLTPARRFARGPF